MKNLLTVENLLNVCKEMIKEGKKDYYIYFQPTENCKNFLGTEYYLQNYFIDDSVEDLTLIFENKVKDWY